LFSSFDALPMMKEYSTNNGDKSAKNPKKGSLCPDFSNQIAKSTRCGGPVGRPCSKKTAMEKTLAIVPPDRDRRATRHILGQPLECPEDA